MIEGPPIVDTTVDVAGFHLVPGTDPDDTFHVGDWRGLAVWFNAGGNNAPLGHRLEVEWAGESADGTLFTYGSQEFDVQGALGGATARYWLPVLASRVRFSLFGTGRASLHVVPTNRDTGARSPAPGRPAFGSNSGILDIAEGLVVPGGSARAVTLPPYVGRARYLIADTGTFTLDVAAYDYQGNALGRLGRTRTGAGADMAGEMYLPSRIVTATVTNSGGDAGLFYSIVGVPTP